MKVLVACEREGRVRDAFLALGHDAMSCDLEPSTGPHYQGDVFNILDGAWDMLVGHPPCTYLANSGVRWLYDDDGEPAESRWLDLEAGRDFFMALWQCDIPRICIENPIPHGHALLPPYTQLIQPWQFGDNFSKATCLWLKNLPPLVPTVRSRPANIVHACHLEPPGPERARNRSKTYPGIARAMAEQWGTDWQPPMELAA